MSGLGWDALRELRIEHDAINGLPIGSLTPAQKNRMCALREILDGTDFEPWPFPHTAKHDAAYASIYGDE